MDDNVTDIEKNFRLLAMAVFSGLSCLEDSESQSAARMAEDLIDDLGIDEFTVERSKREAVRMFGEWLKAMDTSSL